MASRDAITDQEKLDIFRQMEKEGILLNAHLLGTGLKQLTEIKRLVTKKEDWYFLIECPQSFQEKVGEPDKWELAFAFIGEQGVPYRFSTMGGEMVGSSDMLIRVPDSIERKRRRKHFRIKTHPAAVFRASIGGKAAEMRMIDISQGGAMVMFAREEDESRMLATGQELTDIRITLMPGEKESEALRVNQAAGHPRLLPCLLLRRLSDRRRKPKNLKNNR